MFKIYRIGELENYTVRDIVELKDKIDFFPVYQRYSNIWDIYKQKLLIDTILNGFDIPKFYFNYFIEPNNPLNTNNKLYAVIDGKQRLEAIMNFIEGRFSLDNDFGTLIGSDINLSGFSYNQLAERYPEIISKFYSYSLDIIFVSTNSEDLLEELFLRLNGGEALTNAEKRNAIGGEFNRRVREIVEHHDFFLQKIRFNNPRYQHQDVLTKIAFIEQNNELLSMSNIALDKFVRQHKTASSALDNLLRTVQQNLAHLLNVFANKDILLKGKGVTPVYYYFISRENPNPQSFRAFLQLFEDLRIRNRYLKDDHADPLLYEYDKHNQQGVHTQRSLVGRYNILKYYYSMFLRDGTLHIGNLEEDLDE